MNCLFPYSTGRAKGRKVTNFQAFAANIRQKAAFSRRKIPEWQLEGKKRAISGVEMALLAGKRPETNYCGGSVVGSTGTLDPTIMVAMMQRMNSAAARYQVSFSIKSADLAAPKSWLA